MAPMGRVEGFEAEGQDLGFGAWKFGFRSSFRLRVSRIFGIEDEGFLRCCATF